MLRLVWILALITALPLAASAGRGTGKGQAKRGPRTTAATRTRRRAPSRTPRKQARRLLNPVLAKRYSARAYKKNRVARSKVESVLLAAHSSASAFGARPWRFIAVSRHDHPRMYERVLKMMDKGNQEWVNHRPPVLIVAAYQKNYDYNGAPNPFATHDLGIAMGTMTVQAETLGLSLRTIGGFDTAKARTNLKIPGGFEAFSVSVLGYPASPKALPKQFRAQEAKRRTKLSYDDGPNLGDTSFYGQWGKPITAPQ